MVTWGEIPLPQFIVMTPIASPSASHHPERTLAGKQRMQPSTPMHSRPGPPLRPGAHAGSEAHAPSREDEPGRGPGTPGSQALACGLEGRPGI